MYPQGRSSPPAVQAVAYRIVPCKPGLGAEKFTVVAADHSGHSAKHLSVVAADHSGHSAKHLSVVTADHSGHSAKRLSARRPLWSAATTERHNGNNVFGLIEQFAFRVQGRRSAVRACARKDIVCASKQAIGSQEICLAANVAASGDGRAMLAPAAGGGTSRTDRTCRYWEAPARGTSSPKGSASRQAPSPAIPVSKPAAILKYVLPGAHHRTGYAVPNI